MVGAEPTRVPAHDRTRSTRAMCAHHHESHQHTCAYTQMTCARKDFNRSRKMKEVMRVANIVCGSPRAKAHTRSWCVPSDKTMEVYKVGSSFSGDLPLQNLSSFWTAGKRCERGTNAGLKKVLEMSFLTRGPTCNAS